MARQPVKQRHIDDDTDETEEFELDYEKDLQIDPHFLDAEFINHPSIFMKYAKLSAEANKELREAEENVKTIRSQLIKQAKDSGDKHTETTLEAYYRLDKRYIKAKDECVEAAYRADILTNVVFAFQARKVALENLVRLHGQEYFSTPQEPRDLPDAVERLNEIKSRSANNKIKNKMSKR